MTPPRNSTATEPSTRLAGSGTDAMSKPQLVTVLTSPPDTSAINNVQFPLGFSPLNELNGVVDGVELRDRIGA